MRILHVVNELRNIGNGIVNVTVDLACEQARSGHEVIVVSSGGEFEALLSQYDIAHHRVSFARTPAAIRSALRVLRGLIRTEKPHIVHAHTITTLVLCRLIALFRTPRSHGGAARFPLVTTVHNDYDRATALVGLADVAVCVSEGGARNIRRKRIPVRRLAVILNGNIGSPRRKPIEEIHPVPMGRYSIMTLGAVCERKGSDILLDAFNRLAATFPELHLWYVGNMDWPSLLDRATASIYADRIHFPGLETQPARYLKGATVFALASRSEPFGLVVVEAREVGVPIVASNLDGIPEVLDNGRAGVLVEPGNSEALANEIAILLRSPDAVDAWATAAKVGVERFSVRRMAEQYQTVYARVLNRDIDYR